MKYHTEFKFMSKTAVKPKIKPLNPAKLEKLRQFSQHEKLYGTAVIGSRGQIVIPAKARQDFGLKTGGQLLIIGNKAGGMLGVVKAENLGEFVNKMIKHLTEMGAGGDAEERVLKLFGLSNQN
jgi:AbrB family looped-hinge helix DNA binding protein